MLTGQVFALMSGTAEGEQTQGIVRAVDCYLDSPLRGGVCLNTDFGEIGVIAPTLGRQFGILPHGGHVCLCAVSAGSAGGWLQGAAGAVHPELQL